MSVEALRARVIPWLRARRPRLLALFFGVLIPLSLFGILADGVLENETIAWDRSILLFIHSRATAPFDHAMTLFSRIGSGLFVVPFDLAVLGWLAWKRRWGAASFWALAVGGAALLNVGAKFSYARIRPDLWASLAPETTFSFPSGHAMQSMALIAALAVLTWRSRWRWPTLIVGVPFVLSVGLSRAYLGVHYPTDIVAAWAASLGWVAGLVVIFSGRRIFTVRSEDRPTGGPA